MLYYSVSPRRRTPPYLNLLRRCFVSSCECVCVGVSVSVRVRARVCMRFIGGERDFSVCYMSEIIHMMVVKDWKGGSSHRSDGVLL